VREPCMDECMSTTRPERAPISLLADKASNYLLSTNAQVPSVCDAILTSSSTTDTPPCTNDAKGQSRAVQHPAVRRSLEPETSGAPSSIRAVSSVCVLSYMCSAHWLTHEKGPHFTRHARLINAMGLEITLPSYAAAKSVDTSGARGNAKDRIGSILFYEPRKMSCVSALPLRSCHMTKHSILGFHIDDPNATRSGTPMSSAHGYSCYLPGLCGAESDCRKAMMIINISRSVLSAPHNVAARCEPLQSRNTFCEVSINVTKCAYAGLEGIHGSSTTHWACIMFALTLPVVSSVAPIWLELWRLRHNVTTAKLTPYPPSTATMPRVTSSKTHEKAVVRKVPSVASTKDTVVTGLDPLCCHDDRVCECLLHWHKRAPYSLYANRSCTERLRLAKASTRPDYAIFAETKDASSARMYHAILDMTTPQSSQPPMANGHAVSRDLRITSDKVSLVLTRSTAGVVCAMLHSRPDVERHHVFNRVDHYTFALYPHLLKGENGYATVPEQCPVKAALKLVLKSRNFRPVRTKPSDCDTTERVRVVIRLRNLAREDVPLPNMPLGIHASSTPNASRGRRLVLTGVRSTHSSVVCTTCDTALSHETPSLKGVLGPDLCTSAAEQTNDVWSIIGSWRRLAPRVHVMAWCMFHDKRVDNASEPVSRRKSTKDASRFSHKSCAPTTGALLTLVLNPSHSQDLDLESRQDCGPPLQICSTPHHIKDASLPRNACVGHYGRLSERLCYMSYHFGIARGVMTNMMHMIDLSILIEQQPTYNLCVIAKLYRYDSRGQRLFIGLPLTYALTRGRLFEWFTTIGGYIMLRLSSNLLRPRSPKRGNMECALQIATASLLRPFAYAQQYGHFVHTYTVHPVHMPDKRTLPNSEWSICSSLPLGALIMCIGFAPDKTNFQPHASGECSIHESQSYTPTGSDTMGTIVNHVHWFKDFETSKSGSMLFRDAHGCLVDECPQVSFGVRGYQVIASNFLRNGRRKDLLDRIRKPCAHMSSGSDTLADHVPNRLCVVTFNKRSTLLISTQIPHIMKVSHLHDLVNFWAMCMRSVNTATSVYSIHCPLLHPAVAMALDCSTVPPKRLALFMLHDSINTLARMSIGMLVTHTSTLRSRNASFADEDSSTNMFVEERCHTVPLSRFYELPRLTMIIPLFFIVARPMDINMLVITCLYDSAGAAQDSAVVSSVSTGQERACLCLAAEIVTIYAGRIKREGYLVLSLRLSITIARIPLSRRTARVPSGKVQTQPCGKDSDYPSHSSTVKIPGPPVAQLICPRRTQSAVPATERPSRVQICFNLFVPCSIISVWPFRKEQLSLCHLTMTLHSRLPTTSSAAQDMFGCGLTFIGEPSITLRVESSHGVQLCAHHNLEKWVLSHYCSIWVTMRPRAIKDVSVHSNSAAREYASCIAILVVDGCTCTDLNDTSRKAVALKGARTDRPCVKTFMYDNARRHSTPTYQRRGRCRCI
jgi:hypothetical protein